MEQQEINHDKQEHCPECWCHPASECWKRPQVGQRHYQIEAQTRTKQMMRQIKPKVNIEALTQKKGEFQMKLQNRFMILSSREELEEMADAITEAIQECALETARRNTNCKEHKLKLKTKELMK